MNKKKKMMIGAAVAVVVCLGAVGVWKISESKEGNYPLYTVDCTVDNTSDAWVINITNVTLHGRWNAEFNLSGKFVRCDVQPINFSGPFESVLLQDIKEVSSPYGVTWNDNDNDNILSVGDNITINKAGGPDGKFEAGELFMLIHLQEASDIAWIILP